MGTFASKWKDPIRHAQKIARATFPGLRTEKEREKEKEKEKAGNAIPSKLERLQLWAGIVIRSTSRSLLMAFFVIFSSAAAKPISRPR
jgi:hypothetical protein